MLTPAPANPQRASYPTHPTTYLATSSAAVYAYEIKEWSKEGSVTITGSGASVTVKANGNGAVNATSKTNKAVVKVVFDEGVEGVTFSRGGDDFSGLDTTTCLWADYPDTFATQIAEAAVDAGTLPDYYWQGLVQACAGLAAAYQIAQESYLNE